MKRRIIFEFEVDEKLENSDPHYAGAVGAIQIAHEMIKCAVTEHQLEVIQRASEVKNRGDSGCEELGDYIMRFHQAQRSLKVVGFLDEDNKLFLLDNTALQYIQVGK